MHIRTVDLDIRDKENKICPKDDDDVPAKRKMKVEKIREETRTEKKKKEGKKKSEKGER